MSRTSYRVYACGAVIHQDDFAERDNSIPYYDDYEEVSIPDEIVDFIMGSLLWE